MRITINPSILKWARERSRLTVDQLAAKVGREPDEVHQWESGVKKPSYTILEKLAYQYLHIPLAVFFLPSPPDIDDPATKFRRLPEHEMSRLSSDTIWKMRIGQSYQESLYELDKSAPARGIIFRELYTRGLTVKQLAKKVRAFLGVTLQTQYSFKYNDEAFKHWRHALEESGVFTFKDTFADKHISGFCLLDDNYPVIFINNSTAHARQTFTLIHELGHILFGVHGVTDIDESYFDEMREGDRTLEINCNKFAVEVLVPADAFQDDARFFQLNEPDSIAAIANKYSVSKEVILRRLLDANIIDARYYQARAAEWNKEYLRMIKGKAGGNYYLTRLAYLGEGFTRLAYANYASGRISIEDLSSHLRIKAKNIENLASHLR